MSAAQWFTLLWAFLSGASTATDTLASQAYGARDYRTLLVWTFAGLITMTLLCVPVMVGSRTQCRDDSLCRHRGNFVSTACQLDGVS